MCLLRFKVSLSRSPPNPCLLQASLRISPLILYRRSYIREGLTDKDALWRSVVSIRCDCSDYCPLLIDIFVGTECSWLSCSVWLATACGLVFGACVGPVVVFDLTWRRMNKLICTLYAVDLWCYLRHLNWKRKVVVLAFVCNRAPGLHLRQVCPFIWWVWLTGEPEPRHCLLESNFWSCSYIYA